MTANKFTAPDDDHDDWVDVRMQDPSAGEWDIDAIVAGGAVEYVDLRIRPAHLGGFLDCLLEDLDGREAGRLLSRAADRNDVDLDAVTRPPDDDESGDGEQS